jgi:hypothetical protein
VSDPRLGGAVTCGLLVLVASACSVPAERAVPLTPASGVPTPVAPRTTPQPIAPPDEVHFANCTAVRNAGKAPLRRGEPGYRGELDRDNDGIACET